MKIKPFGGRNQIILLLTEYSGLNAQHKKHVVSSGGISMDNRITLSHVLYFPSAEMEKDQAKGLLLLLSRFSRVRLCATP